MSALRRRCVRKCVVRNCDGNERYKESALKFFPFPKSPRTRNAWLMLLKLSETDLNTRSCICSRHFKSGMKSKKDRLPTWDIGISEDEMRAIIGEYMKNMMINSRRPVERVFENAVSVMEAEDDEEPMDIGSLFEKAAKLLGISAPDPVRFEDVGSSSDQPGSSTPSSTALPVKKRKTSALGRSDFIQSPLAKRLPVVSSSSDEESVSCISDTGATSSSFEQPIEQLLEKFAKVSIAKELLPAAADEEFGDYLLQLTPPMPANIETTAASSPVSQSSAHQVLSEKITFGVPWIKESDFRLFTGITKSQFDSLYLLTKPSAEMAVYWYGPKQTRQGTVCAKNVSCSQDVCHDLESELLMTLMKLRTDIHIVILGTIFGWSKSKVSRVFHTWIDILSRRLHGLIFFPDQMTTYCLIPPKVANKFPTLRCIIDCTEIYIQRPQAPSLQSATYSNYKKANTIKVLLAILPNGAIGFVSRAYPGRASDKFLMDYTGLLDLLNRGDTILADRGFSITDEVLVRGVQLNAPPGAAGKVQFTAEEVRRGQSIANVRVHVERAIGRIKVFKILHGVMPIPYIPIVDKIINVCAALVNLQEPLIK